VSPRLDLVSDPDGIGKMMFSNQSLDKMEEGKPEVLIPLGENPRVRSLRNKERFYKDKEGNAVSKAKLFQLRDGIFEAVIDRFYKDRTLAAWGEENRDWGGAFAVYRGRLKHSLSRLHPISRRSYCRNSCGYRMRGSVIAE
jgi:2-oxoisovalerate dehydrogenase E1 component